MENEYSSRNKLYRSQILFKEVIRMKMTKNGVAVIGIDHGYGNIKTANTITPTGVTAYDKKPVFEGTMLFYDNTY